MKKILMKAAILLTTLSLAGCYNMSNQDVGVVTGAVAGGLLGSTIGGGTGQIIATGVGAVAGALIGGAIGRSMDEQDYYETYYALDHNPVGVEREWVNDQTGTTYVMVPGPYVTYNGMECRRYHTTAIIGGQKQRVYGMACPTGRGQWQAVNMQ